MALECDFFLFLLVSCKLIHRYLITRSALLPVSLRFFFCVLGLSFSLLVWIINHLMWMTSPPI